MQSARKVLVVGATGRLGVAIGARAGPPRRPRRPARRRRAADDRGGVPRALGRIDDVVIACGPFPRTRFEALRREDLPQTLAVHEVSPLLLVHALAADLAEARGTVVARTDAGVTRPYTNQVAYLIAKGALLTGLRALAPEVRVHIVALGIVADPEADDDPLRMHRLATRSPLGRFGTAEEVVHVMLSLPDATLATGEIWGVGR